MSVTEVKVTIYTLKCNYWATSTFFILAALRSRKKKQVLLDVDKIQLVRISWSTAAYTIARKKEGLDLRSWKHNFLSKCRQYKKDRPS